MWDWSVLSEQLLLIVQSYPNNPIPWLVGDQYWLVALAKTQWQARRESSQSRFYGQEIVFEHTLFEPIRIQLHNLMHSWRLTMLYISTPTWRWLSSIRALRIERWYRKVTILLSNFYLLMLHSYYSTFNYSYSQLPKKGEKKRRETRRKLSIHQWCFDRTKPRGQKLRWWAFCDGERRERGRRKTEEEKDLFPRRRQPLEERLLFLRGNWS